MKAINIQRRRLMTSLALSALAAAPGAAWAQAAAKAVSAAKGAKIVVVGAGVGGATAAKYLKLFNENLDVTLIDRNPHFIRHYGSSELVTGAVTMADLTVSYKTLADRYGIRVVQDTITGLDADRRLVVGERGRYAYDKLIVSPGIELLYDRIPGYSAEIAATKIPSGWIAGAQTQLLADQLKAMPQGGTFCLVAPPNPYRCPPGPYERAALVTEWCAKHNPTAKIIVTDPKNDFVTDETMLLGWNRLYGFPIPADYRERLEKYASPARPDCRLEWVQAKNGGRPLSIDAGAMTVTTEAGVIKADVINVVPPMRAANVALAMGLADKTGFCRSIGAPSRAPSFPTSTCSATPRSPTPCPSRAFPPTRRARPRRARSSRSSPGARFPSPSGRTRATRSQAKTTASSWPTSSASWTGRSAAPTRAPATST